MARPRRHTLAVIAGERTQTLDVPDGANLRQALLAAGLSPYAALTRQLNCGGRGLCATCGVWLETGAPPPAHWHDELAARFGYPRLSCQITVTSDLTVRLVTDKRVWGRRDPARRWRASDG
ncbi:MAG: 2Fe-2S iron-sulfur cluster-binding protein [Oscillochloridaceae bacterium]|nr:(2Fe-2S)-binding protein [Chloroflexaceae bacterium]MDW8389551.1 2Fe-2S iron-sulfur cluster-binding protein [Oscillochloridaceae bacterium]